MALDATRAGSWRFNTIPRENEPGGNTWNGVPYERRNGGSVWTPAATTRPATLSIRHRSDLHTGPIATRSGQNTDLLHRLDDPRTRTRQAGVVFPHQPNDQWDYDWAFGRMLLKTFAHGKTLVARVASRRSSTP